MNKKAFQGLIILSLVYWTLTASARAATITVNPDQLRGSVNTLIYGNAQPFGHGDVLLNMVSFDFAPQALEIVDGLKPTVLRFPGGDHADKYFWEDGVGPHVGRPEPRAGQCMQFGFHYGTDEHLALCERIGAEAFITVNYASGIKNDVVSFSAPLSQRIQRAADWVEYCNAPNDGSNPNGGVDWAAERAANGHPEPYQVKFWEIGNEIHSGTQPYQANVDVYMYASDVVAFSRAMKAVDASIQIGAVGVIKPDWRSVDGSLLEIAGEHIDFLVVHTHYPGSWNLCDDPDDLYRASMAGAHQALGDLAGLRQLVDQKTGPSIAIVPGENGMYCGEENYHLAVSLLAGLHMADLLMAFVEQSASLNISFACGWMLSSWVYSGDIGYEWWPERRYPRPEYYAHQMFREHFGDVLVAHSVQCNAFSTLKVAGIDACSEVPELSVSASIDAAGESVYLMVLNRQLDQDVPTTIQIEAFEPQTTAQLWVLNGIDITATNEVDPNAVALLSSSLTGIENGFSHTFPAHSLTVIELKRSEERQLPPIISDVSVAGITGSCAEVIWTTDRQADSRVEYGTVSGLYDHTVDEASLTTEHRITLQPLQPETGYYFRVISRDDQGNEAVSDEMILRTPDVTPPLISGLEVLAVTETTATIIWQTDEPGDSRLEYSCHDELIQHLEEDLTREHLIVIAGLWPTTQYTFGINSADSAGNIGAPVESTFTTGSLQSGAEGPGLSSLVPGDYQLWQNYPNPFNANTTIRYQLPLTTAVTVRIYNSLGQLVTTLVEEYQSCGQHQLSWDGSDGFGDAVGSGIYLCSLQAGDFRETRKMTLLR